MKNYKVIVMNTADKTEQEIAVLKADSLKEARIKAVVEYLSQINMIRQVLKVVTV